MLAVDHLQSAYGPAQVLFDIGLRVDAGEVVTLLGRNGMGKTTTIHTIMGLLPATGGSAVFDNLSLVGLPPHRIAQAGLGLVPEGRQIFPELHRRGEPDRDGGVAFRRPAMVARPGLQLFSAARRAATPHGQ